MANDEESSFSAKATAWVESLTPLQKRSVFLGANVDLKGNLIDLVGVVEKLPQTPQTKAWLTAFEHYDDEHRDVRSGLIDLALELQQQAKGT